MKTTIDFQPIERLIRSVGITTFIKYFYDFEALKENAELIAKFDENNENWKEVSKKQKANNGKRIFREERAIEALEYIIFNIQINSIKNADGEQVKKDAIKIYENSAISTIDEQDSNLSLNEKKVLVDYRLQQGKFRKELMMIWEGCSVTKVTNPRLLTASHIKPYNVCEEKEKYDGNNGLLLTPVYDKLFDSFLITFNSKNGKIKISKELDLMELKKLNITGEEQLRTDRLTASTRKYLIGHNERFEKQEKEEDI